MPASSLQNVAVDAYQPCNLLSCPVISVAVDQQITPKSHSVVFGLQDAWTPHASTLLKYFAAEGLACQQRVFWARPPNPREQEAGASPLAVQLPKQVAAHSSRQVMLSSLRQVSVTVCATSLLPHPSRLILHHKVFRRRGS